MKDKNSISKILSLLCKVFAGILIFFVMCVCAFLCLIKVSLAIWEEGYRIQEKKYYSDKSNFESVTAKCGKLGVNSWFPGEYYLNVEDMEYEITEDCRFISLSFDINKANSAILKEAGIEEKLTEGKTFTFISAPEYFGDGYACPIVGIEIDGEVLLDFDTGYENLMNTYRMVPSWSMLGIILVLLIILVSGLYVYYRYRKSKRNKDRISELHM